MHTNSSRHSDYWGLLILLCFRLPCTAQQPAGSRPYQDLTHYSRVFSGQRYYRLYLPVGYETGSKRYPVIYYFHGWGGRYFKDVNAKLEYAQLKTLVNKYQVILVMADGTIDGIEPDPYNVGMREDVKFNIQYKDYFLELVRYTDTHYRTLTDRGHRAIMGFSMGGFMALYLGGAYPDLVCAVMSFAGSPELMMGFPQEKTLYPVRYTFKNLQDVAVRIHNGNSDILYYLNEEVRTGARWEGKDIAYWSFNGGHMIDKPGETMVFEKGMKFVAGAFKKTWPAPGKWSHYDLYSGFTVWGYQVSSDKKEPGFILLKNVTPHGFGISTLRWLPDGPPLAETHLLVSTASRYVPGKYYNIIRCAALNDSFRISRESCGPDGRMHLKLDGSGNEVGIFENNQPPEYVLLGQTMNDSSRYLRMGENKLSVRLLNRGGEAPVREPIRIVLSTRDSAVQISNPQRTLVPAGGQRIIRPDPFVVSCAKTAPPHAEPPEIKFTLTEYIGGKIFTDDFTAPVLFDAPFFDSLRVDDGVAIRDTAWGAGNGDGIADAGENILLYQGLHRLRLYTDDPWVIRDKERLADEALPARWPDGFTLSSIIRISGSCPDGHEIICLASYETKTFNPIERKLTWGKIRFTVHHNP